MPDRTCRCGQPGRLYLGGVWCDTCRPFPATPTPDPETTAAAFRERSGFHAPVDTHLIDDRAIASGKRRSNPQARKDAQRREDERKRA